MPPFSVAYVKGWRRSLACLIIFEGIRVLGVDMEELTPAFKAVTTARLSSSLTNLFLLKILMSNKFDLHYVWRLLAVSSMAPLESLRLQRRQFGQHAETCL